MLLGTSWKTIQCLASSSRTSCDDGQHPVWNDLVLNSCSAGDVPAQSFAHCFTTYVFQNNGLIASPSAFRNPLGRKRISSRLRSWPSGLSTTTTATAEINALLPGSPYKNKARTAKILEPILPDSLQRWLECNKSVPVPHPKVRGFSRDLIFCLLQRDFISLKTTVISSKWGMLQEKTRMVRTGWLFPRSIPFHCSLLFAGLSIFVTLSTGVAAATAPPTGENAYCGKGDVPQFGEKDGPAELPKTCYYTGLEATPSPENRFT